MSDNKYAARIGWLKFTYIKKGADEFEISTVYNYNKYVTRCHLKWASNMDDFQTYLNLFPGTYTHINGTNKIYLKLPIPFTINQNEIIGLNMIEVDAISRMQIKMKRIKMRVRYTYLLLVIANAIFYYTVLTLAINTQPNDPKPENPDTKQPEHPDTKQPEHPDMLSLCVVAIFEWVLAGMSSLLLIGTICAVLGICEEIADAIVTFRGQS